MVIFYKSMRAHVSSIGFGGIIKIVLGVHLAYLKYYVLCTSLKLIVLALLIMSAHISLLNVSKSNILMLTNNYVYIIDVNM